MQTGGIVLFSSGNERVIEPHKPRAQQHAACDIGQPMYAAEQPCKHHKRGKDDEQPLYAAPQRAVLHALPQLQHDAAN